MARSSTVTKLSRKLLDRLIEFCIVNRCGITLRLKGIDYGFDAAELEALRNGATEHKASEYCVRNGWDSPENMWDSYVVEWLADQFLRCIVRGDLDGKHGISWAYWAIGNAFPVPVSVNGLHGRLYRQVSVAWQLANDPLYKAVLASEQPHDDTYAWGYLWG